jgi:hypothetical protein
MGTLANLWIKEDGRWKQKGGGKYEVAYGKKENLF